MNTSPSSTETIQQKVSSFFAIRRPWLGTITKLSWIALICFLVGFPLYIYSVKIDLLGLYGEMPSIKEVENPENDLSSELISADAVSLGRYYRSNVNRSPVTYADLSEDLVNTLLLSEDHRFYQHSGLDFIAFLRVAKGILTFNTGTGGGSTITQQLAKNLYTRNPSQNLDGYIARLGRYPRRIVEKTKEWIIAINLESSFTKEEIMAMYLNTVEFSSNSSGIKVAAETYFNKSTDSLNLMESAVLVGMLQNPSRFNPHYYPERAIQKRNEVLRKLLSFQYKIKTKEEYDSLAALPIELNYRVQNQNVGLATYFRSMIAQELLRWSKERNIDLYNSGLKIYTTIDSRLQQYAEEAMREHMSEFQKLFEEQLAGRDPWIDDESGRVITDYIQKEILQTPTYKNLVAQYGKGSDSIRIMLNLKKPMTVFNWGGEIDTVFSSVDSLDYYRRFLQSGFMAMDPNTGDIKAWVGGINHKFFKYDHVRQGRRQPGSTFKPFVYGLAMENGYSPCQIMKDISPSFDRPGGPWWPMNADGTRGTGEVMNLRQAMARSVNSITAQVMKALGEQNVVDFAHRMGITSFLDPVPPLCLGTSDVSLYEMVGAYGTYVNSGKYTEPFFITRIEDKNGNVLDNFVPNSKEAISEQTAYKMIYMLMGGVEEEGGTSRGLSMELKKDNEVGGKTGTTNNASDGWYVGLTHDLVAGVWVGGDERVIHFPSWAFGSGSRSARPIWEKFMLKAYADPESGITKGKFKRPASGLDITLDCIQYQIIGTDTIQQVQPWDFN